MAPAERYLQAMGNLAVEPLLERLARGCSSLPEVRLAFLFGSQATGRARPDSDVDVALLVDDAEVRDPGATGRTLRRIAGRLGREVASTRLDLVLLNQAPALLRHGVLRDGLVLWERSPGERARFARRTIRDHQDTQVRRERLRVARIRRLKRGLPRWWTRRSSRAGSTRCTATKPSSRRFVRSTSPSSSESRPFTTLPSGICTW